MLQAAFRGHLARAELVSRHAWDSEPPGVPSLPSQVTLRGPANPEHSQSPLLLGPRQPRKGAAFPSRALPWGALSPAPAPSGHAVVPLPQAQLPRGAGAQAACPAAEAQSGRDGPPGQPHLRGGDRASTLRR